MEVANDFLIAVEVQIEGIDFTDSTFSDTDFFDSENLLESFIHSEIHSSDILLTDNEKEEIVDFLFCHDRLRNAIKDKEEEFDEVLKEGNEYQKSPLRYHGLKQSDFL